MPANFQAECPVSEVPQSHTSSIITSKADVRVPVHRQATQTCHVTMELQNASIGVGITGQITAMKLGIPEPQSAIRSSAEGLLKLPVHEHAVDGTVMSREQLDSFACLQVPQTKRGIEACSTSLQHARAHGHARHWAIVAPEPPHALASVEMPEQKDSVMTTTQRTPRVPMCCRATDHVGVADKLMPQIPGCKGPHIEGLVTAPTEGRLRGPVHVNAPHFICVASKDSNAFAYLQVPQYQRLVLTCTECALGRPLHCQAPHRAFMAPSKVLVRLRSREVPHSQCPVPATTDGKLPAAADHRQAQRPTAFRRHFVQVESIVKDCAANCQPLLKDGDLGSSRDALLQLFQCACAGKLSFQHRRSTQRDHLHVHHAKCLLLDAAAGVVVGSLCLLGAAWCTDSLLRFGSSALSAEVIVAVPAAKLDAARAQRLLTSVAIEAALAAAVRPSVADHGTAK
mmetsp:Transcript_24401/g.69972  ORF Transcript_24401/g.69972 Transcript_24401/m.69972 type:complete len:455 (+) Transcript_24401:1206-2570(+)